MKYALALAGGGTRGAFEVGVWKAIKEMGLNITAVCGTSVGAINGALFIANADSELLWKSIKVSDIAPLEIEDSNLLSPSSVISVLKSRTQLDTSQLKNIIASHVSEQKIRNSDILFGLCTYNSDKKSSTELFIDEIPVGLLIEYIAASACFPLFEPVEINGDNFIDGGIQNNLPINMLIRRGFDTIISVSVKGIGMIREINRCGVNIINIDCRSPLIGAMEFDRDGIEKSIISGYIACMKTFGRLCGSTFTFDFNSYTDAVSRYGTRLIANLEKAAKLLKINPIKIYTVSELAEIVLTNSASNPSFRRLINIIENNKNDLRHYTLDRLCGNFNNANAVVYLSKHSENQQKNIKKKRKRSCFLIQNII